MNFIIKKKARNIFFMFLIIIVLLMSCNLSLAGKESTVIINTGLVERSNAQGASLISSLDHLLLKVEALNETIIEKKFLIKDTLNVSVPSNVLVTLTLYGIDKENNTLYSGSCKLTLDGEKKYKATIEMIKQGTSDEDQTQDQNGNAEVSANIVN